MAKILIVDDDDQLRKSFTKLLTEEGHQVLEAPSGEAGIDLVKTHETDLVILDMRLSGINGFETFKQIHAMDAKLPVIIMTAYGTTETAIEATKMGAFDYILKPFDILEMLDTIEQAVKAGRFSKTPVAVGGGYDQKHPEAIVGKSKAIQDVYKSIGRVSSSDATVLIRGDSGTGKELVARAIYHHSMRASKPFLVINCVAIPENLIESELFGYEKGAFTGAAHRRIGKIEQAHGGTVFLDEIGDMPIMIQAKILRLLQERSVERLGGRETIPVDVRIIAATNRDLERAIEAGRFREDLYYRLKVVTIHLPPLNVREGDIQLLADFFMMRYAAEMGVAHPGMNDDARVALQRHSWPGNIRELENTIQKVLIFNRGAPITAEDINSAIVSRHSGLVNTQGDLQKEIRKWVKQLLLSNPQPALFDNCMNDFAAIVIGEALAQTGGNRTQAAELLGLSRPTLHAKIEKFGLKLETSVTKD